MKLLSAYIMRLSTSSDRLAGRLSQRFLSGKQKSGEKKLYRSKGGYGSGRRLILLLGRVLPMTSRISIAFLVVRFGSAHYIAQKLRNSAVS
ncbi:MAG TPA: hypothetical protein V6C84_23895 [Coleofasciculaceae cyanobacterium]